MRFERSGPRSPCPCCGRTKTSHCAWHLEGGADDTILCHDGQRFGPPPGLKIGDVTVLDGRAFALVATGRGFAAASHVFKPHSEQAGGALAIPVRYRASVAEISLSTPSDERVSALLAAIRQAFPCPAIDHERIEALRSLMDRAKGLLPQLRRSLRHDPALTPDAEHLEQLMRALRFELEHLERCLSDGAYRLACGALLPSELPEQQQPDWEFWQQQQAPPTHPWAQECQRAGELFWSPVARS
jgi:hypothetical protein